MFWEFFATISAGLAGAGIALALRKFTLSKAPKWLIPSFAGLSMLTFQIHSEYTWFDHQSSRLPEGVIVLKTVEEKAPWRPWSYLYPQTLRFIAVDIERAAKNHANPDLVLVDLYFFERRQLAKRVPQVIHCGLNMRADFTNLLDIPQPGKPTISKEWKPLKSDDPLKQELCHA
ncbi:hypothetical protein [Marinomonas mediterranea]|jgi:hypothetical protein|uniref:Uncharacterized protein n=1 Tax=Marinomonas mediterranea (strain ATCC 700492 / JCM 21426 / NBRC 103028 / MMB-1) TaxID=717774 RepID=F2K2X1_MARM1|nr:hypothetical protein [Marinomonas mediterranea]ADZ92360.1 hypothetical protein Marme_3142 [Marinomonas mediterranea MMB-1]WCN18409.1 hypothetical protein GV053_15890 [Marinomonas mediterranea MMB-1]